MTGTLLDTDVVSALRIPHQHNFSFQKWLRSTDLNDCFVSSLTWMEIEVGVLRKLRTDPSQGAVLQSWVPVVKSRFANRTIAFDSMAATVSAPLWLLRSRGSVDTLIAGTALAHQLALATRNTTHFADIPDLTVINPWA